MLRPSVESRTERHEAAEKAEKTEKSALEQRTQTQLFTNITNTTFENLCRRGKSLGTWSS